MPNNNLTIVAQILAKVEKRETLKQSLLSLLKPTRAEEGCINYDLHQDHENPNLFLFYENWTSRELWQKHMNSSHIQAHRKRTEGAVESFTLFEMNPIDQDQ